jgi:hypothetical protein
MDRTTSLVTITTKRKQKKHLIKMVGYIQEILVSVYQ